MEHLATIGHVAVKSIVGNLAPFQRLTMINALGIFDYRILDVFLEERV